MNGLEILKQRGFIAQMTHEIEMTELFDNQKVVFYCGYDPTADSLHIGHYLTFMALAWLQRLGHVPIVLLGGGTGMVGDPDKADKMRPMMGIDEIDHNVAAFKRQAEKYIDFSDGKAILVNNAEWLRALNYASFIREYGVHFSVNRMLAADKYKTKFEGEGLNFLELNYQIMQAYDFLELNRRFGCIVQIGGNDQWSNIIAGVDLIRRVDQKQAFGMTFTLLEKSDGTKMGKTMGGAIWIDETKTSPHEFYQYFRNLDDESVKKTMCFLTFLPMEQIEELCAEAGEKMNRAKEVLAYEVTKIVHGEAEAEKAAGSRVVEVAVANDVFGNGMNILDLLVETKLTPSKSEARRNVQQGGIIVGGAKITDPSHIVSVSDFTDGGIIVQKGKKAIVRVVIE
ncbi:MAG: tyrosine--tRNA ligase [Defluviitaleaceae bacterium]|nr:tyrosine--tRNA ligase [Defluviitaleaceae bacterium]